MKALHLLMITIVLSLGPAIPALASGGGRVYSSGLLVMVFLGFCSLVLVSQLIPALVSLWRWLQSSMTEGDTEEEPELQGTK